MLSKQYILDTLEKHAGVLKNYRVAWIGLFGSYLHGSPGEQSDIDLLVHFSDRTFKTFHNYMNLKYYLEDLFGCEVDLIPVESLKPALLETVYKEVEYPPGF